MQLTKVHRNLKLKESDWLKNTLILIQTKEKMQLKVLKDFFKLLINSIYGKTIENLRKRIIFSLVDNAKDYKKYVSKPTFTENIW